MTKSTRRSIRTVALTAMLPLGLIAAASCAPAPNTCPTIPSGAWAGTWANTDLPGLEGTMTATLTVDGSSINGNAVITGNGPDTAVSVMGSIDCASVSVLTSDGMTLTGTASDDGESISGTYVTSPMIYHGTFQIDAD